jgi:signal transduction histidine kinase
MVRDHLKPRLPEIEERARIARELHDTVLQVFTAATLLLQIVADDLRRDVSPDTAAAVQQLDKIIGLTSDGLSETRRAVMNLRDPPAAVSLTARLESTLHQILDSSNIQFELRHSGTPGPLSADAEEQIVRICQEALRNVVRHSNGRHVTVTLADQRACLRVTIADDGQGFSVDPNFVPNGHFGLIGMRERAAQAGGELAFRSAQGRGTAVVLTVPYATAFRGAEYRAAG